MIKNIIFDVGGILFDDSKKNIEKLLNKNCDIIYKLAYGKGFKDCLLGNKTIDEYIYTMSNYKEFDDIKYILQKNNLPKSYPLIIENYQYIKSLKEKEFNLYLLTNITRESFEYVNETIKIDDIFLGGVYSYMEHVVKPDLKIYELIIKKFNLKKEETIFFDDKEKNVKAAINCGISSFVFKSIDDIKNNI